MQHIPNLKSASTDTCLLMQWQKELLVPMNQSLTANNAGGTPQVRQTQKPGMKTTAIHMATLQHVHLQQTH